METHIPEMPYLQWKMLHASFDWLSRVVTGKRRIEQTDRSPHWIGIWVRKGNVSVRTNRRVIEATAGEWIFNQPGRHHTVLNPGTELICVAFSIRWMGGGRLLFPLKHALWKGTGFPELEEKTLRLFEAVKVGGVTSFYMQLAPTKIGTYFEYCHLFFDWLKSWDSAHRQHSMGWCHTENVDEKAARALQYIDELPLNQPIRIGEIASDLGISTGHLTFLFQQQYGMPPKAYRMQLKLKQAIQELQTTADEVKEIASRQGCSTTWFHVWIKRETGQTPLQLRRQSNGRRCETKSVR